MMRSLRNPTMASQHLVQRKVRTSIQNRTQQRQGSPAQEVWSRTSGFCVARTWHIVRGQSTNPLSPVKQPLSSATANSRRNLASSPKRQTTTKIAASHSRLHRRTGRHGEKRHPISESQLASVQVSFAKPPARHAPCSSDLKGSSNTPL